MGFHTRRNKAGEITGYRVRWNYRPKSIDGRPHDERDFVANREAEARAFWAALQANPTAPGRRDRMMDLLATYMESPEFGQLEQRTRRDIEACVRKHITPAIGTIKHSRLTSLDVIEMLETMTSTGYPHLSKPTGDDPVARASSQRRLAARPVSVPTANKTLRYLKAIMRWARPRGYTTSYAVDEVQGLKDLRPKSARRAPARAYTDDEKDRLRAACATHQELTVVELDWDSGLRRGELFALHWDQVLWDEQEIHVNRALNPDGSTKDPKTHEVRFAPVFDDGWAELARWAAVCAQQRGCEVEDLDGFVFLTRDGRPLDGVWEQQHAGRYVQRSPTTKPGTKGVPTRVLTDGIRKRSGIHLELGHCRDTYASELINSGVEAEELKMAVGHETLETTLRHYGAWLRARRKQLQSLVRAAREARRSVSA